MALLLSLIISVLIIITDQITKYIAFSNLTLYTPKTFLNGILNFYLCENDGAAWSIFSGKKEFLIFFTSIVILICLFVLFKNRKGSKLLIWSLMLVVSGGIGNLIDRIFRDGKVIDFLQFDFYKSFPVFNIADIAIVIGVCLLILYSIIDIIKDFKTKKTEKLVNDENK